MNHTSRTKQQSPSEKWVGNLGANPKRRLVEKTELREEDLRNFWKRVEKKGPSECWLWSGCQGGHKSPYGIFSIRNVRHRAHRISYIIHNGSLSENLIVCHRCDTPACVNPDHLFSGTQLDNINDCISKGRYRPNTSKNKKTHCKYGHRLDGDNLYIYPYRKTVIRRCVQCHRNRNRSAYHIKKLATP